ncbi:MAG: DUF2334 domain-containing protein [Candidatus Omnitrophota bacterium]
MFKKKRIVPVGPLACLIFGAFFLQGLPRLWAADKLPGSPKKVLLLYHQPSEGGPPATPAGIPDNAVMLTNLLGHFDVETANAPVERYIPGMIRSYDYVFYLGWPFGAKAPADLEEDIPKYPATTVVWLRWNFESFIARYDAEYGFKVLPAQGGLVRLIHEGQVLSRATAEKVPEIQVTDRGIARTSGLLDGTAGSIPFAVRAKNLWYFPDHVLGGVSQLLFCELLHEVFGEPHVRRPQFYIRIEDIHPNRDPARLREICRELSGLNLPFMMGVIPQYRDPKTGKQAALKDRLHLVSALRGCMEQGGSVLLHGYTHQWKNESGEGHEFWDVPRDRPIEEYSEETVREKLESGIRELVALELYPLGWETPHYAASERDYRTMARYFSTAVERRQVSDRTYKASQEFPYMIRDIYGQRVIPENLGYVNLEENKTAEDILRRAAELRVVRDAVAGVFYHSYFEEKYVRKIAEALLDLGFEPLDLREFPAVVRGENAMIFAGIGEDPFPLLPPVLDLAMGGEDPRTLEWPMDGEWLRTALMDFRWRTRSGFLSSSPVRGRAVLSVPLKDGGILLAEKLKEKPSVSKTILTRAQYFLIGETNSLVGTVQRWLVWALLIFTAFFVGRVAMILLDRTSSYRSHFRKKD